MSLSNKVRTRYAPSPTGYFHVGGARTALFNYLFARHHQGTFICRIEDTDIERNIEGGIDSQLDNLEWLNITPDESIRKPGDYPPYIQSQKLDRYQQLAQQLIQDGKAYYCFCSKEELQQQREEALQNKQTPKYSRKCLHLTKQEIQELLNKKIPAAIRLKTPDDITVKWKDLIRGDMSVPSSALTDPVILKSNGIPMYNFAVVVDDYDMQITHVLRGEEHISNTPYQIIIKEALGFDKTPIEYGHLSIIVDEYGKKLSKRNKELKQFIEDYKIMGFLPEAITNFITLLGWTNPENVEILSLQRLEETFDINRVSKAPAFFDFKKMLWIGSEYIKKMTDEQYLQFVKSFIHFDCDYFEKTKSLEMALLIFKPQISHASQINDLVTHFFLSTDFIKLKQESALILQDARFKRNIQVLQDVLKNYAHIDSTSAKEIMNQVHTFTNFKGKELYFPVRFVAIGKEHGPEMDKLLTIVGKERILQNIKTLLES